MSYSIEQIINRPDTWQGRDGHGNSRVILTTKSANTDWHNRQSVPTGFESLDKELHLRGWPTHGAVEVLSDHDGSECMGLFLPTLDSTIKSLPKYLDIVLAFAGDSTITNDFAIINNLFLF